MRILRIAPSIALAALFATHPPLAYGQSSKDDVFVDLTADVVWDKIRGGLLGQMLGNLNGIPHEHRYISEPGDVSDYTPALPSGARTDDDTDFEWVYIDAMQRRSWMRELRHWTRRVSSTRLSATFGPCIGNTLKTGAPPV